MTEARQKEIANELRRIITQLNALLLEADEARLTVKTSYRPSPVKDVDQFQIEVFKVIEI